MEILKHLNLTKAPEQKNLSRGLALKLSDEDSRIINLKNSAKPVILLNKTELITHCEALLIRIHIITGWTIPGGNLLNVLVDQFQKKLIEDYPTFNAEEIEYAFRHSGTLVDDWGKTLNLNLIDKVLWPYELKRRRLSEEEERMQPPPQKKPYDPQEVLNQYRFEIETAFQAIRKGYRPIIHIYFAETLIQDGLMKEGENIHEFLSREVNNVNRQNLYVRD
jgi:hypothetical protein